MRVNRWLFIVGVIGVVCLNGCTNASILGSRDDIQVPKEEKQEIVVWHTYGEEETSVFENKIIPLFEKQHPMIDVKPVRQAYNEQLKSALIARASAKKAPDVVRMDIVWTPRFAQLNLLRPVSDFDDFNQIKKSLLKEPLESNYYNGKYYGLPLNTNIKVAIYNKSLLHKAGYTEPPDTIDELLHIINKNKYVFSMGGYTAWEGLPFFYALGGTLMDDSYTTATGYLNSPNSIHAVEKMFELYKFSNFTGGKLTIGTNRWQEIINGNSFMIDEGPWFYSSQSPEHVEKIINQTVAAPFPVTNGKGSVLGGENLVITKGAKNPAAAWLFVKWMVSKEPQQLMLKTGLIPTNKDIERKTVIKDYPYYEAYINGLEHAFLRPPVAEWDKVEQVYTKYFRLMLSERMGIVEGLTMAAKEIDQLLAEEKGR